MAIFRESKLSVRDLELWSENPRFPVEYFGKTESELIDYIVSIPIYKIKEFAKEIVQDFDMPIFEKLAIFDGEGENITVEGNRRLTVYKLLVKPELCSDLTIQEYFHQLKRSILITSDFKIDCVLSDNKKEILRYVNRKHLNNNNEARWGTIEQFNAKFRWIDDPEKLDNFKINLQIIVKNLSIPQESKNKILGRGFVTTLFRILNSRTAASHFQLVFNDDHELISGKENFYSSLIVIINDILEGKEYKEKKFSRLNAREVEEYLKSITILSSYNEEVVQDQEIVQDEETADLFSEDPESITWKSSGTRADKKNDNDILKPERLDESEFSSSENVIFTAGTSAAQLAKPKPNKKSTDRKYLIRKECKLVINQPKINNIYIELKRDLLLDDSSRSVPNAVSVLFRVFLECSVDFYSEKKHGHNFKKDITLSQKLHWVVAKLKDAGHNAKIFTHIEKIVTSGRENSVFSVQRFNDYVHDGKLEAGPNDLKKKWDILEGFFEVLWGDLN